ncbi:uncharacterized protein LOC106071551 [Biomphalaria glabrata]|uniref:Uncharacterized protein LOC106071551 n=1 Tax=Biomphalaria glabrata TaxID=6526 RepID=A0A9W3ATK3_BIOGL|nr:uncharacterized protein LOC106071551 [Biomphalaria glabrata]
MSPLALRVTKLVIFAIITASVAIIYLKLFKRPPVDVLMKMNKKSKFNHDFGAESFRTVHPVLEENEKGPLDELSDTEENDVSEDDIEDSDTYWRQFIEKNHFIPIGGVYNKCEGTKLQLGSVILIENKEDGSLLARTFVNFTLHDNVTSGTFSIKVKYNSKDLFEYSWELCELEDDIPEVNRTFTCPIQAGKFSKVKDKTIPGYLPAGRYQTKAWIVDEHKKTLLCGYSDFSL